MASALISAPAHPLALAPAGVLAAGEASAPVTHLGLRLLLTLATIALIGLGLLGMRRGWRNREARQAGIATPPAPPADLAAVPTVAGLYVATTVAGDLLDRVVAHGLGHRARAQLGIHPEGVLLERIGEVPVWIPRGSLRDVRLGRGQAQKAFEAGGVILIRWALGDHELETGFRADDPDEHVATASALAGLVTTSGGTL